MPLNYRVLENKSVYDTQDGPLWDMFTYTYKGQGPVLRYVTVEKDYIARPDLISLAVYGTDGKADIICKYNGISNPFDLNEGMVLKIPYDQDPDNMYNPGAKPSKRVKGSDQINIPKNTYQKRRDETRSPNEQTLGEQNYFSRNGFLYY